MKYKIVKASRSNGPYRGATCQRAGVQPGKIYDNRKEAEDDARKLTEFNRVGFKVCPVNE